MPNPNELEHEEELELDEEDEGSEESEEEELDEESEEEESEEGDESDEEEESEESEEEEQPTRKSRAANRTSKVVNERNEARAEAERLRQANAALVAQVQTVHAHGQQMSQADLQRQRTERLSKMSESEKVQFLLAEQNQMHQANMMQLQFQVADTSDRSAFQAKAAVDPLYKRMESQVETKLKEYHAKGQTVPREELFAYLVGKEILAKKNGSTNSSRKKAADKRLKAVTTKSTGMRSDTTRGRKGKTAAQRLEGVLI